MLQFYVLLTPPLFITFYGMQGNTDRILAPLTSEIKGINKYINNEKKKETYKSNVTDQVGTAIKAGFRGENVLSEKLVCIFILMTGYKNSTTVILFITSYRLEGLRWQNSYSPFTERRSKKKESMREPERFPVNTLHVSWYTNVQVIIFFSGKVVHLWYK